MRRQTRSLKMRDGGTRTRIDLSVGSDQNANTSGMEIVQTVDPIAWITEKHPESVMTQYVRERRLAYDRAWARYFTACLNGVEDPELEALTMQLVFALTALSDAVLKQHVGRVAPAIRAHREKEHDDTHRTSNEDHAHPRLG